MRVFAEPRSMREKGNASLGPNKAEDIGFKKKCSRCSQPPICRARLTSGCLEPGPWTLWLTFSASVDILGKGITDGAGSHLQEAGSPGQREGGGPQLR